MSDPFFDADRMSGDYPEKGHYKDQLIDELDARAEPAPQGTDESTSGELASGECLPVGAGPTKAQALEALDAMDDFARMADIDPIGPRKTLESYINGAAPLPEDVSALIRRINTVCSPVHIAQETAALLEQQAARIAELEAENAQAKEAIEVLNAGRPLGDIVGLHTARNALARIAELERLCDEVTITLQSIEAEHKRLGEMIQALKQQRTFPITVQAPALAEGEIHVGTLISADGLRCEHLILLPGEFEGVWQESLAWAESVGGQLPDRVEGAILFAHAKDEFESKWYWTREQRAANSDYAWCQGFNNGYQGIHDADSRLRARAVRRLPI